jgi:hypothetical protein
VPSVRENAGKRKTLGKRLENDGKRYRKTTMQCNTAILTDNPDDAAEINLCIIVNFDIDLKFFNEHD